MKLIPRSMGGQLVALMLLALLAAHVVALVIRQEREEHLHPLATRFMLDRVAGAYHAARLSSPEQSERIAQAVSAKGARFWMTASPPSVHPGIATKEEAALERALRTRFTQAPAPSVQVRITEDFEDENAGFALERPRRLGIYAAVALPDGRWLSSYQQSAGRSPWWRPLLFSIPVSTLPVLLVSILFIRRMLRPIRALESAAERISRGEQGGPLQVIGPREARELTAAFNLMEERQRSFLEGRTRMLAAMSHDLRTPITSLRLRAEMIDDAALRGAMTRTLEDMTQMVDETLRFARDESVDEEALEVDLAQLVQDVIADATETGRPVAWSGPRSLLYRCRPIAIRRALANLVHNAMQHASEVGVSMSAHGDGREIIIEVVDNGPGIDPTLIERAFEPFVRLDPARNKASGGSGLGLSIARSCIHAHGGRLHLSNRPAGGLAACITLPV